MAGCDRQFVSVEKYVLWYTRQQLQVDFPPPPRAFCAQTMAVVTPSYLFRFCLSS
jgi:hypothetical protein